MNAEIKKWEQVILSNKNIEPKTAKQFAAYQIAEYFIMKDLQQKQAA